MKKGSKNPGTEIPSSGRCGRKKGRTFCRSVVKTVAAAVVVCCSLFFLLLELAGESWFIKWWVITPVLRQAGMTVTMGRLDYQLLTGNFRLENIRWADAVCNGSEVAVAGNADLLAGRISFSFHPWQIVIHDSSVKGAELEIIVLSDAEVIWAEGEEYILPQEPPPFAGTQPAQFFWDIPEEMPESIVPSAVKPSFMPEISMTDLNQEWKAWKDDVNRNRKEESDLRQLSRDHEMKYRKNLKQGRKRGA